MIVWEDASIETLHAAGWPECRRYLHIEDFQSTYSLHEVDDIDSSVEVLINNLQSRACRQALMHSREVLKQLFDACGRLLVRGPVETWEVTNY